MIYLRHGSDFKGDDTYLYNSVITEVFDNTSKVKLSDTRLESF